MSSKNTFVCCVYDFIYFIKIRHMNFYYGLLYVMAPLLLNNITVNEIKCYLLFDLSHSYVGEYFALVL